MHNHWMILLKCNIAMAKGKYHIAPCFFFNTLIRLMHDPKDTLEITYPTNAHMHYPHQGNANALDHFIFLQYPSRPNHNYFISFISSVQ
jgi:hypothetical protein